MWKNWQFSKIPQTCTVSQERLQPMSDGKRHFIVGSFLCYSYKLILISPGIFHRALFEKWLTLVAEKSPESAKFTYSNLEAFNVHPPSYVILILKKMPFLITLLYPLPDKSPHLAAENSQTAPWGPFDSPEGWVHHKICLAIFGLLLGAIWKQKKWPGQQGGPGNRKNQPKICVSDTSEIDLWGLF